MGFGGHLRYIGDNLSNSAEEIDGEFPDYTQVLPKKIDGRYAFAFNAEYLKQLADVLSTSKTHMVILCFDPKEPEGPLVVLGERDDALGVLMPVRMIKVSDALEQQYQEIIK